MTDYSTPSQQGPFPPPPMPTEPSPNAPAHAPAPPVSYTVEPLTPPLPHPVFPPHAQAGFAPHPTSPAPSRVHVAMIAVVGVALTILIGSIVTAVVTRGDHDLFDKVSKTQPATPSPAKPATPSPSKSAGIPHDSASIRAGINALWVAWSAHDDDGIRDAICSSSPDEAETFIFAKGRPTDLSVYADSRRSETEHEALVRWDLEDAGDMSGAYNVRIGLAWEDQRWKPCTITDVDAGSGVTD